LRPSSTLPLAQQASWKAYFVLAVPVGYSVRNVVVGLPVAAALRYAIAINRTYNNET
tara:strand:+ start:250 stop:420 length:171 start_codon:yes stop_codon:yes gene_type:complete